MLCDIFTVDPRFRATIPEIKARIQGMKTFFRDKKEVVEVAALVAAAVARKEEVEEVELEGGERKVARFSLLDIQPKTTPSR